MGNKKAQKARQDEVEPNSAAKQLYNFIQNNADSLARTLRMYVSKAGLAKGETVPEVAVEVLQETVIEALRIAHRFDPSRQPQAWLLGIAANIIKRKRVKQAIVRKYEVAVQDMPLNHSDDSSGRKSDSELFDRIASLTIKHNIMPINTKHRTVSLARDDVAQGYDAKKAAEAILAQCSPEDRFILRIAILEELDNETIANLLNVTRGTARVRLHRAIQRLRKSFANKGEESNYEQ